MNQNTADRYLKLLKLDHPQPKTALTYRYPVQLVVSVILSAQATDKMVNLVTRALFKKYRSVRAFAEADLAEFELEIKQIGLYRAKAKNIISMARKLRADFNSRIPRTIAELQTLPGVGRKSANVIQGALFDKPEGIAVDTHVSRLSGRLGLSKHKDPKKIEDDLKEWFKPKDWVVVSHLLILHGRATCAARKPVCSLCKLNQLCPQIGVTDKQRA